ncbi:MAG: thermonuclease family protein [Candidatus Thiodiazotropha sp. (ex Dulcina madagascariensis)]|nr:thermonuclease family protein [Candidatus Thiodiazotropha sp. (ex Dulcina madagascariensis)]MCU7927475.1 thermonuclease family protein [Candidatus Thiodiazotropha sp. (ex Dulcina madagascariensis)]
MKCLLFILLAPQLVQSETLQIQPDELKVEDGDTLLITMKGETKRVQLLGIDAPEAVENPKFKVDLKRTALDREILLSLGIMASNHLRDLVKREEMLDLYLQPDTVDRYGRLQGELYGLSDRSLNQAMIADGFAVVTLDGRDEKSPRWRELQQQSVKQKKGLWGLLAMPARRWAGGLLQH